MRIAPMDTRLRSAVLRFAGDTRGATAIEYSLVAGGVACAIATTITMLGGSVQAMWTAVKDALP
ncbi:MAG: hypothetical protein BGP08_06065 [Rhizobiales bacterium 64-17]|nr:MAG: hypothetical protein BGP08_06065 [Rhizobiales bacterium 64-17]